MIKQITVFVENKPGRLAEVTGVLAGDGINLHALSIADTTDFGILRMIVSDPEKARAVLKGKNLMVQTTDVVAMPMGHAPGSLHKVLRALEALELSIEYMYAFTSRLKEHDAVVILRLANQEAALGKLEACGMVTLGQELIDRLNEL